ncbi:MAG TPA: hypothetical protein VIT43_05655 [Candidatus Dormibacteraeota bacterium]
MLLSLRLLRRIAKELPRYGKLTYCLYRDPRVPVRNKMALAAAMAVILNPVVDVPLRLPVFGEMDAVALTVLAIRMFVDRAPKEVVAEHQERIALGTSIFDQDIREGRAGLQARLALLRERGRLAIQRRQAFR